MINKGFAVRTYVNFHIIKCIKKSRKKIQRRARKKKNYVCGI